jgi:hypothetical protein
MSSRLLHLLALIFVSIVSFAQQPPAATPAKAENPMQATIRADFGEGFVLDAKFTPLTTDFDSDGTEDIALVAVAKEPMANSNDKNFRVIDPYDGYFGFGDPKVTSKFSNFGDGSFHCVLIVHDWHNAAPKAKFVIVNLPFETLELTKRPFKKKTIPALSATELGGLSSLVFWDGKKYKWEPTEFSTDTRELKGGR